MNKQLNNLVVTYQTTQDDFLIDEIFKSINPFIEKTSREIEHLIEDVTKFDCRMILKVKKLLETFDEEKDDFLSIVKTLISREKSDFIKRRSRKLEETSMNALTSGDSDEELGFQFEDPLARVEDEVVLNEKIALLAQDDLRRKIILTQWSKGADNKSISVMLAHQLGGNSESHRRFITRFRNDECRPLLKKYGALL